jgi:hypothetical protein
MENIRKAPRTDDERWRELLGLMGVPNHAGIYVLGCFAQHVTFYSQQVRALNLIDALCKTGELATGGSIGVVGAGLAGLTSAAAALQRGLRVHLFQKDDNPQNDPGRMPLQMNSDERWVDPFIYDWPPPSETSAEERSAGAGEESASETNAGLPLLNWKARTASEVRRQVLDAFKNLVAEEERKRGQGCIHFHKSEVREEHLKRDEEGRWSVEIDASSPPVVVDVLVLAVGFGVEASPPTKDRYWTNDGLAGNQADRKSYLISGVGDGGLTDVMRLCIADFKHRTVLEKFKNAKDIGSILESAVKERRDDLSDYFIREAGKVGISREDQLNLLASRENQVYVTGSPELLFGAKSKASILNRLIVAWLFREGRFTLVDARLRTPLKSEGVMFSVEFTRWESDELEPSPGVWVFQNENPVRLDAPPPPHQYNEVIVRHGPGRVGAVSRKVSPLEECFPTYSEASSDNLKYWKEMPHWDDWTRRPIWGPNDFNEPPLLDPPAGKGLTYLVVEHPNTEGVVQRALDSVITRLHENDDSASRPSLITLDLAEEFQTPHRFGRAVRALCRADIVVFDLTEKQYPEAFVLLGIRSVARRGITIVTTRFTNPSPEPEKSDAPFAVPTMPFLLQDINFCGWGKKETNFITRLKKGIEEGRARAERLGLIYRDLPAYEEVRQLGPEAEDYRVQGPDKVVLFLSPFDEEYRVGKGSWLRARIRAEETGMYIIESASPERTSLKLYSAIRRTQLCVVDLTGRRENVFFELGVRLAVSPNPPICVIHEDEEWAAEGSRRAGGLFGLLRPLVYNERAKDNERRRQFEQELQSRKSALNQTDSASAWPLNEATLSPNFVYREVRAAIPVETEHWNVPVWKELQTKANLILGSMPDQYPDLPILFGDDPEFKRQASRSGLDRLLAAWYFLERRHDVRKQLEDGVSLETDQEPLKSLLEIGPSIVRQLKHEKDEHYARMRDEINELLKLIDMLD